MRLTLARKIVLFLGLPILLIFGGALLWVGGEFGRAEVRRGESRALAQIVRHANVLDGDIAAVESTATLMAGMLGGGGAVHTEILHVDQIYEILEQVLTTNEVLGASTLAFEPHAYLGSTDRLFAPYIFRHDDGFKRYNAADDYDYTLPEYSWYSSVASIGKAIWTELYYGQPTDSWYMSYGVPLEFASGTMEAVFTVDLEMKSLVNSLSSRGVEAKDLMLLTKDGRFAYHADRKVIGTKVADFSEGGAHSAIGAVLESMIGKPAAILPLEYAHEGSDSGSHDEWFAYAPVEHAELTFVMRVDASKALADAAALRARLSWLFVGLLAVIVALVVAGTRFVAKPVNLLATAARRIAAGESDAPLPEPSKDEVGDLTIAFRQMVGQLGQRNEEVSVRNASLESQAKELDALFGLAGLAHGEPSTKALLDEAISLLPPLTRHPESARARIQFQDVAAASPGYEDGEQRIRHRFEVEGKTGRIDLVYLAASDEQSPPAFDASERTLVKRFASTLELGLARLEAESDRAQHMSTARLYQQIVKESEDAVVVVDNSGGVVYWSPAAEALYGIPAATTAGRDPHHLIVPEAAREPSSRAMQRLLQTGEGTILGVSNDRLALRGDGSTFWVSVTLNLIKMQGKSWAFAVMRDIHERKLREIELREMAETDALTGIANRRTFQGVLESHIEDRVYLGMADIDFFKKVNDTHGHDVGDVAIKFLADELTSAFPEALCVARLGGEEFGVLFEADDDAHAFEQLDRCRKALGKKVVHEETGLQITLSLGFSSTGVVGPRPSVLLKTADLALYAAKQGGRNRVMQYERSMGGAE